MPAKGSSRVTRFLASQHDLALPSTTDYWPPVTSSWRPDIDRGLRAYCLQYLKMRNCGNWLASATMRGVLKECPTLAADVIQVLIKDVPAGDGRDLLGEIWTEHFCVASADAMKK